MIAAIDEPLAASKVNYGFSKFTSKGLAALMRNGRLWIPGSCKASVKSYSLLTGQQQRAVLHEHGIYRHTGFAEVHAAVGASAHPNVAYLVDLSDSEDPSDGEELTLVPFSELPVRDDEPRRLRRKTMMGHIDHDTKCVIPHVHPDCRLVQDLGRVWTVNWGTSLERPEVLYLWGSCPSFPAAIRAIAYRENGLVNYSDEHIWHSSSARWLVRCDLQLNKKFCRMLLFLSPRIQRLDLTRIRITFVDDEENSMKAVTDDVDAKRRRKQRR